MKLMQHTFFSKTTKENKEIVNWHFRNCREKRNWLYSIYYSSLQKECLNTNNKIEMTCNRWKKYNLFSFSKRKHN